MRNLAFDLQWLKSRGYRVPVISVGNLSAGGTGKTPMVEYLVNAFRDKNTAVVSRGYGRKTKGLILAGQEHTASEIGDEPYQIYRKFPHILLALSEKRLEGIDALLAQKPELILLDDAYQHRYVKAGFQILLTTFDKPYYKDLILPAGNLRESTAGRKRADAIIITKCPPGLDLATAKKMVKKLGPVPHQQVFCTSLAYGSPVNHQGEVAAKEDEFTALSGIADPRLFLEQLQKSGFQTANHLRFGDHHHFSESDLEKLTSEINSGRRVITTEKDWVRLMGRLQDEHWDAIFYLPVKVQFLFGEEKKFLTLLRRFTGSFDGMRAP